MLRPRAESPVVQLEWVRRMGEIFDMPGIVSRKKQLIPYLTTLLKEMVSEGAISTNVPFRRKKRSSA